MLGDAAAALDLSSAFQYLVIDTSPPIAARASDIDATLPACKHAGIHGMNAMLDEFGVKTNEEQTKQIKDVEGNEKWKKEFGTLFIIGTKPTK